MMDQWIGSNWIGLGFELTSGDCEGGKLELADGEAGVVVRRHLHVVVGGWVQVQDNKVAAGFDAVGYQGPFFVVPERTR